MRLNKRVVILVITSVLGLFGFGVWWYMGHTQQATPSGQTDVDRAEHLIDSSGVPYLNIEDVGKVRHPAWTALYALAYAGVEDYEPGLGIIKDDAKFAARIKWLKENLKLQPSGYWVWEYAFDNTYNDIAIQAPWSSAFAQATGIQALLAAYRMDGNREHLDIARKASHVLFAPIKQGGLLFQSGEDVWFEEIPVPANNPSHILNGHMRVLLALKELADVLKDETILSWYKRGSNTLYRWLPRFDSGYWLRYDLNVQKQELLFRFANSYGFKSYPVPIDKITLRDPTGKQEVTLDVGSENDAHGTIRIAGNHWAQLMQLEGRSIRRLVPAVLENKPDEFSSPYSYIYLRLPTIWQDNLREQHFELAIDYYDEAPANINLQMRSIAPGQTFRDLRGGNLDLTGSKQWKRSVIQVRPSDLGYWVGKMYAEKHALYLSQLAEWDSRFKQWSQLAASYSNIGESSILKKEGNSHSSPLELEVVSASPTYPGHSFVNSIDGDPNNNYTAGIEYRSGHVVLAIKQPADLSGIRFHWESERNYSGQVVISQIEQDGSTSKVLSTVKNLKSPISSIEFSVAKDVKLIRIDFSDFIGQSRILLRQIELIHSSSKNVTGSSLEPSEVYLGSLDAQNPLHIFRMPVTWRIKNVADNLANGVRSDHEKIVGFMRYINDFRVGVASNGTPDATLLERVGACGSFTNTLIAMSASQGIRGRYVNLLNFPKYDGHTAAELFINGRWRFYDPTCNAYYVDAQNADGLPLSFEQIKQKYMASPRAIRLIANNPRPRCEYYTGRDIFVKSKPSGVIGPSNPMVFPLVLDLTLNPSIDESSFGPRLQGADFLGAAYMNQNQEWALRGLSAGHEYVFSVYPKSIAGDIGPNDNYEFKLLAAIRGGVIQSKNQHIFNFRNNSVDPWRIRFKAFQSEVQLNLRHPYRGPAYRYMSMERYHIVESRNLMGN